jgi:hypothetical protein
MCPEYTHHAILITIYLSTELSHRLLFEQRKKYFSHKLIFNYTQEALPNLSFSTNPGVERESGLDVSSPVLFPFHGDIGQGAVLLLGFYYRTDFTPSLHCFAGRQ